MSQPVADTPSSIDTNAPAALRYVSEDTVRRLVGQGDVTEAIAAAFVAHARHKATNFPVVRQALGVADATFGFKAGFDRSSSTLGVKAGGLWPANWQRGIPNHQSTILLFDPETGAPSALIGATYLTALRTAAASALSIRALSRPDSRTLGIVGAGGQARWQVLAALVERPFDKVLVQGRNDRNVEDLVALLRDRELAAASASTEELCAAADVIITITPAKAPLIAETQVRAGTHLACVGADTIGKQEVAAALVARATLFGDEADQAVVLGECQHAFGAGLITRDAITPLGNVLAGTHPGRSTAEEITLFDSTGMALQDLAAAQVALKLATESGRALELPS